MRNQRPQRSRFRRFAVYSAVALTSLWIVADTILALRLFFGEHRGIAFYQERPLLIGVCLLIAIALGLSIKLLVDLWQRRAKMRIRDGEH